MDDIMSLLEVELVLWSEEENAGGQQIMIIGGCFDTSDIICYREL